MRKKLGATGSAEVWEAERDGQVAAVKFLMRVRSARNSRYRRFLDEVRFLREMAPPRGVLPLLDSYLPEKPRDDDPPWLAMPVARTLPQALGDAPDIGVVVGALREISRTLAALADLGIAHRDVKPANLFELDSEYVVGDFGLVTYPDKPSVTKPSEKLGPAHFIADEMISNPDTADPHPADVFSFAKTLWVLAVPGERYPPSGQLRIDDPSVVLSRRISGPRLAELDLLIERATERDPAARPSMRDVADELAAWLAEPLAVEVPELDALAVRVRRLSEPGLRAEQAQGEMRGFFDQGWTALVGGLQAVKERLDAVFPRVDFHGNPAPPPEFADTQAPLRLQQQLTHGVLATNADPQAVELQLSVGGQWVVPELGRWAAWITIEDAYAGSRRLWSEVREAPLGSAQQAQAVVELLAALAERLPGAANFAADRMALRNDAERYASWTGEDSGVGRIVAPLSAFSPFVDDDAGCYVVDSGNNRVLRFGPGGAPRPFASAGGDGLGYENLAFPSGGCFTHDRKVWIADHNNARLRHFDEHGQPLEGFGLDPPGDAVLRAPADVGSGPDGSVYVVDRLRDGVLKFSPNGQLLWERCGSGREPGEFRGPCGIAVRHGAFVYVSDSNNHRIQKLTGDGELVDVWGGQGLAPGRFNFPHGIALDIDENVYVADSANARIQQFTSEGNLVCVWGQGGSGPGNFQEPRGVSVDGAGNVYVAEHANGRIQRFAQSYLAAL